MRRLLLRTLVLRERRERGELEGRGLRIALDRLEAHTDRALAGRVTHAPNRRLLRHLRTERPALFICMRRTDVEATDWQAEHAVQPASDAARDLLNDYRTNGKRSLVDVQRHVRMHLEPFFGRRRISAITTADVRQYVARRQAEGVKNATINRELSVLKRSFTLAIAAGNLSSRPHIPLLREDNVRRGFFEPEQFEAVRRRLPSDLADFVTFLYTTGWRWRSEVAKLHWSQVDFKAGEVRLDPGTTKTGEGRVFPFTAELRALLERRRAITREREKELGRIIPHVFTRPDGEPVGSFNKAWATACKLAGCPGRVLHDFRRTAVRNLVRAGVPERVPMQMVGWKSRQMLDPTTS